MIRIIHNLIITVLMNRLNAIMATIRCGITRIGGMTASRIQATALPFMTSRVLLECRMRSMMLFMVKAVLRILRRVMIMSMLGIMAVAMPMFVVVVVVVVVVVIVLMTVGVRMVMIRMGVMDMLIIMIVSIMLMVMMMVMVVPLAFAERIGPHQSIQIDGAHPLLQGMDTLIQQSGDLGLEAEVGGVGKADLRVLGRQIFHLPADALDERAGEQVVRHDDDLHHAQRHLVAHHFLQAREGHAGEGQVHALVITNLPQPAGHACHVPIGQPVAGAAPQQDDAGGTGIRHVQLQHGLTQEALQDP